jgi:nicotinamidase/pyrazinamidase
LRALLRIDVQRDFCLGGNLAVPGGDEILAVVNRLSASGSYDLVVDSQDWHPHDHGSFASQHPGKRAFVDSVELNGVQQQLWPEHCVQGSPGAEFHPLLDRSAVAFTVRKGTHRGVDSYSAFFDNGQQASDELKHRHPFLGQPTELVAWLADRACREIHLVGLALDYCVASSARDAVRLGYRVTVVAQGCRAIGDADATLAELRRSGVETLILP